MSGEPGVVGVMTENRGQLLREILFADDAILLAESETEAQKALDTVEQFYLRWGLVPNPAKCEVNGWDGNGAKADVDWPRVEGEERNSVPRHVDDSEADVGRTHQAQEEGGEEMGLEDEEHRQEERQSADRSGTSSAERRRAGV